MSILGGCNSLSLWGAIKFLTALISRDHQESSGMALLDDKHWELAVIGGHACASFPKHETEPKSKLIACGNSLEGRLPWEEHWLDSGIG